MVFNKDIEIDNFDNNKINNNNDIQNISTNNPATTPLPTHEQVLNQGCGYIFPTYSNNFQPNKFNNNNSWSDENHVYSRDREMSIILFVTGFFFILPWIVNIIHIKSKNSVAKGFSIASLILFLLFVIFIIIIAVIFFLFISSRNNRHNEDY